MILFRPTVSPIVYKQQIGFSGEERNLRFENGRALAAAEFEKNDLIESLEAKGACIAPAIHENSKVNGITWAGEETMLTSFF